MEKVATTNEILTALLSDDVRGNIEFLKANPRDYIAETYKVNLSADLDIVENSESVMHLPLPYYAGVGENRSAALDDDAMGAPTGGLAMMTGYGGTQSSSAIDSVFKK